MDIDYKQKYLKYKLKYLSLQKLIGGDNNDRDALIKKLNNLKNDSRLSTETISKDDIDIIINLLDDKDINDIVKKITSNYNKFNDEQIQYIKDLVKRYIKNGYIKLKDKIQGKFIGYWKNEKIIKFNEQKINIICNYLDKPNIDKKDIKILYDFYNYINNINNNHIGAIDDNDIVKLFDDLFSKLK